MLCPVGRTAYAAIAALLGFTMYSLAAAEAAELVQLKARRVVALVLGAGVVPVFTLCTGHIDDYAICFLCHFLYPCIWRNVKRVGGYLLPRHTLSRLSC